MQLTMLVPPALRRLSEIREVEPEIVSRGDEKPWVVQLLLEGQLPGASAEPHAAQPVVDEPTLVAVEAEPEPEPRAERAPAPLAAPAEQETAPPHTRPTPPKAVGMRTRAKQRHAKRVHAPQRAAAHVPTTAEVEPAEPRPEDVEGVMCEIRFWKGYRMANFYACVVNDDGEPLAIAESPAFRARGTGIPDKTDEAVAAYEALRQKLEENGWRRTSAGRTWYADAYSQPA